MLIAKIEELQRIRKEQNHSKRSLSVAAGLPINAIFRIENRKYETTHPLRAKAIAEALGVDVEEIFTNPKKGA